MNRTLSVLGLGLLTACGCSSGNFPVAATDGRVVCDGEPVANAQVYFEPIITGKSAKVGKQGFAFTDQQGMFTLSTYGTNDGAVVGKHRVRVGGDASVKCDCITDSEKDVMEVQIEAGQTNSVEISLPRKDGAPARRKPKSRGEAADAEDAKFDNQ